MIALTLALALALHAADVSDEAFCAAYQDVAAEFMAQSPMMIDTSTRIEGMSVHCASRTVIWSKTILADAPALTQAWQTRKQHLWDEMICSDLTEGPMAERGWSFVQKITFLSGLQLSFKARCEPNL